MKIYPSDQLIIRSLVERRNQTQRVAPKDRKEDSYRWGISFLDLFRDINDSLSFSTGNGSVYVHVADDTIPHGKNHNEDIPMHYNQTIELQVKVLQRLLLLRRLEKERPIVWINSGKISPNFAFEDKMFFLINEEDRRLVQEKIRFEAVAAEELVELVKNNFMSDEDIRFAKTMRVSWTAIVIAILIGVVSIVIGLIQIIFIPL